MWVTSTEGVTSKAILLGSDDTLGPQFIMRGSSSTQLIEIGALTTELAGTYGVKVADANSTFFRISGAAGLYTGLIAGWNFDATKLYNATGTLDGTAYTTTGIVISSAGYIAAPKFRLEADGKIYATEASISGAVTATSGSCTGAVNASSGNFTGAVTVGTNASKITLAATSAAATTAIYAGTGVYGNANTGF